MQLRNGKTHNVHLSIISQLMPTKKKEKKEEDLDKIQ